MPLLDTLQVSTYSRYFKDIMGNKHEIPPSTVKLTEECSVAIANEAPERRGTPDVLPSRVPLDLLCSKERFVISVQV